MKDTESLLYKQQQANVNLDKTVLWRHVASLKVKQESRAIATKPHDAACFCTPILPGISGWFSWSRSALPPESEHL